MKIRLSMLLCCSILGCGLLSACRIAAPPDALPATVLYNCGETGVRVRFAGDAAMLDINGMRYNLAVVPAASGVLYETAAGVLPHLSFHTKSDIASLSIDDNALPACEGVSFARNATSYRAQGNEPGWHVVVRDDTATVTASYGAETFSYTHVKPVTSATESVYRLDAETEMTVTYGTPDAPCEDDMSGRYHADRVVLHLTGRRFSGCGSPIAE